MRKWLHDLAFHEVPGHSVAAMRIVISLIWVIELSALYGFHDIVYDLAIPGQSFWMLAWIATAVCMLVGYQTRWAALASFLVTSVFVHFGHVAYHIDYYALIVSGYLVFMDSGRCWSVDAWRRRKAGHQDDGYIWSLPILLFLVHAGTIYLDAGVAHVDMNGSWRQGYAVGQALIHPHLNCDWGFMLGHFPWIAKLLTYGTLVFELGFIFLLAPFLINRRYQLLATGLAIGGLAFHGGIGMTLDIGMFGPYTAICLFPLLPAAMFRMLAREESWSWRKFFQRPPERPRTEPLHARDRLFLYAAPAMLFCCFMVQIPVQKMMDNNLVYRSGKMALKLVGDYRPHDVFSGWATEVAFTIEATGTYQNGGQQILPILFSSSGERIGYGMYMRLYMYWLNFGRKYPTWFRRDQDGSRDRWCKRFEKSMAPLLNMYLSQRSNHSIQKVDFRYRFWRIPKGMDAQFKAPAYALNEQFCTVTVLQTGDDPQLRFDYTAHQPVPR